MCLFFQDEGALIEVLRIVYFSIGFWGFVAKRQVMVKVCI